MTELYELSIHEADEKMRTGEISSEELTLAILDRIENVEPKIAAYVTRDAEKALASARAADAARKEQKDNAPTLLGIPLALKDNFCTIDYPTTCSSRILANFNAPYDAHVVEQLREQGAVILGKTNLDEFAMGSSTETSAGGPTRNPWNTDCIPGGSSGGSAAAVAAGMAIASLGSDTGGSIRQPASHCGVVGLKPTYGRVSRYGLVAFGSSLDQIGPLTRDVRDAAILLQAIAGHDQRDSTSAPQSQTPFTIDQMQSPEKLRIGIVKECGSDGLDAAVADTMDAARKTLENMGAEIVEVSLPHMDYAIATYYLVATAEASSNLARYDGAHYGHRAADSKNIIDMFSRSRAEGFGDEVKRRIMLGTYVLSAGFYDAYYLKALKVRTLIKQDFEKAFEQADVLLMPTAPTPAFKLGEKLDDPLQMYLSDIFTIATNLAGIPALSIPAGYSRDGLPVGVQFQAPAFEEANLLSIAAAFEQAHDLEARQPEL